MIITRSFYFWIAFTTCQAKTPVQKHSKKQWTRQSRKNLQEKMYCRFPWERWSKAWQPKVTLSLFKIFKCHARDNKWFRCCGVTNTTQDTCRYKGAECFKCHKTVHNSEDGFRVAIFSLESASQDLEMSAPTVKVPVQIEDIFKWKWILEQRHLSWVTQNNIPNT